MILRLFVWYSSLNWAARFALSGLALWVAFAALGALIYATS